MLQLTLDIAAGHGYVSDLGMEGARGHLLHVGQQPPRLVDDARGRRQVRRAERNEPAGGRGQKATSKGSRLARSRALRNWTGPRHVTAEAHAGGANKPACIVMEWAHVHATPMNAGACWRRGRQATVQCRRQIWPSRQVPIRYFAAKTLQPREIVKIKNSAVHAGGAEMQQVHTRQPPIRTNQPTKAIKTLELRGIAISNSPVDAGSAEMQQVDPAQPAAGAVAQNGDRAATHAALQLVQRLVHALKVPEQRGLPGNGQVDGTMKNGGGRSSAAAFNPLAFYLYSPFVAP